MYTLSHYKTNKYSIASLLCLKRPGVLFSGIVKAANKYRDKQRAQLTNDNWIISWGRYEWENFFTKTHKKSKSDTSTVHKTHMTTSTCAKQIIE